MFDFFKQFSFVCLFVLGLEAGTSLKNLEPYDCPTGVPWVREIREKDSFNMAKGITEDSLSFLVWILSGIGRKHGVI